MYDYNQDYTPSFVLAGSCMLIAAVLMVPPWILSSKKDNINSIDENGIDLQVDIHVELDKDTNTNETLIENKESNYLDNKLC